MTLPESPNKTQPRPSLSVGLDASRSRSGGAKAHLQGILKAFNPTVDGIAKVHVWSYSALLAQLPDEPWLIKHNPPELEKSLMSQAWWQWRHLSAELEKNSCDILLTTDAATFCNFRPAIVMSRDMLAFEPGESSRFGMTKARVRIFLLRHLTIRALRRAEGALFLTKYAANVIQKATGPLRRIRVIPHGIGEAFRRPPRQHGWSPAAKPEITCVYVSNVDMYKHQWHVVKAVGILRRAGHPVVLKLVGGGEGRARTLLDDAIAAEAHAADFVEIIPGG